MSEIVLIFKSLIAIYFGYTINVNDILTITCNRNNLQIKGQTILSYMSIIGIVCLFFTNYQYFNLITATFVIIEILVFKRFNKLCSKICQNRIIFILSIFIPIGILYIITYYSKQCQSLYITLFLFFFLLRNNKYSHHYIKQTKKIFHSKTTLLITSCLIIIYILLSFNSTITYCILPINIIFFIFYWRNSVTNYNNIRIQQNKTNINLNDLPDFSFAGYHYGEEINISKIKSYNVSDYGISPHKKKNQIKTIQNFINRVGEKGGGIIYFPHGDYIISSCKECPYIKINYSNIIIKGEMIKGQCKTHFISQRPTLKGEKNPWLSPFIFTTGENIQCSNIFWGVQFRKKKNIITKSPSMTDPGSDGSLLEPQYATKIIGSISKGSDIIPVENTQNITSKFILIVAFNSSENEDLIKYILNHDKLDESWKTAKRAGTEVAPSLQWLVEIKKVTNNKIILTQPARWNINEINTPCIFNVNMLENIGFKDIIIHSTWSGLFRHHGAIGYFSKESAQVMDYGWNCINMKRVAHGFLKNVIIDNFTNPLYIQDSRNITVEDIVIKGSDGHQGLKIYGHACDNLLRNITFYNHYADFIGGETCCYGNVFSKIKYLNPENKYVDFDFHGFSEGPFSPPMQNLFECCEGIRGIKGAGASFNVPSSGRDNIFWNIYEDGYNGNTELFDFLYYTNITTIKTRIKTCIQNKSLKALFITPKGPKIKVPTYSFFCKTYIIGYTGNYKITINNSNKQIIDKYIYTLGVNEGFVEPFSLYEYQSTKRKHD